MLMEASSAQVRQEMATHVLVDHNMLVCPKVVQQEEKKPRPQPEKALKCPRCDSTNTKFCYYNNYSLSQPRYFCKSCRRYWTKGGTLRNVPVGGGCRKNKRSSTTISSSSSSTPSKIKSAHQDRQLGTGTPNMITSLHNYLTYDSNDLTLAFARLQKQSSTGQLGIDCHQDYPNSDFPANPNYVPSFDALRTGFLHDAQNPNFQSLYYGYGNIGMGEVDNNGVFVGNGETVMPYEDMSCTTTGATTQAVTVTTMKQELCSERDHIDRECTSNKVLWGYPWQFNGNGNMGISTDLDSAKESWINGLGSTWHGLLNSPLM